MFPNYTHVLYLKQSIQLNKLAVKAAHLPLTKDEMVCLSSKVPNLSKGDRVCDL